MISNKKIKQKIISKYIDFNSTKTTNLKQLIEKNKIGDGDWILSKDMCEYSNNKLIQLGSIGYGIYIRKGFKYISDDKFDELKCSEISKGDLLINRFITNNTMTCCIVSINEKRLLTSVDVCWIKEDQNKYLNKYLMYCFLSDEFQEKVLSLSSGTTRIRISKSNLSKIDFPIPPIEEQKRIVKKIEELFELIDKKEKNDQEKEKLKTLLKEKILDSAIRGKLIENDLSLPAVDVEEIKDNVPFDIPSNWKYTKIEYCVTLTSGVTLSEELKSGDILYVKVSDMNLPENKKEIITSSRYQLRKNIKNIVPVGSIIFPKRGGAIKTNKKKLVLRESICVDLNTMAMTPNAGLDIMYLYYWFMQIDLGKLCNGTSVPQINNKDLNPLKILIPPLEQQKRIVDKIEKCFELIEQL